MIIGMATSQGNGISWEKILVSRESELQDKINVEPLLSRLEREAGGFMTRGERASVENERNSMSQVSKIVAILRKKTDEDFSAFISILNKSGNEHCAELLESQPPLLVRKSQPRKKVYKDHFPRLRNKFARLVRDLQKYLHTINIAENLDTWEAFLAGFHEKVSPNCSFPTDTKLQEFVKECQKLELWDFLNCDVFLFVIEELVEMPFSGNNDTRTLRESLQSSTQAYKEDLVVELNEMLDQHNGRSIIPGPSDCGLVGMKCLDHQVTLDKIFEIKAFLIQILGLEKCRFAGIEKGCIQLFFYIPFTCADALQVKLSVCKSQITEGFSRLNIVQVCLFDEEMEHSTDGEVAQGLSQLQFEERRQRKLEEERSERELEEERSERELEEERRRMRDLEEKRRVRELKEERNRKRKIEEERKQYQEFKTNLHACSERASVIINHRERGAERMRVAGNELDSIFGGMMVILLGAAAGSVVGIGLGFLFTGGLAAPAIAGAVAGGGLVYTISKITTKIRENAELRRTDAWIMEDRENFKQLLISLKLLDIHWEKLTKLPNSDWELQEFKKIRSDLDEALNIIRRKGYESGKKEDIHDATVQVENEIRQYLESQQQPDSLWYMPLFTDTEGIGRVGGGVLWRSRKRPPVKDLLNNMGEAISKADRMEPIRKLANIKKS